MSFPEFKQNLLFVTIQHHTLSQVGIDLNATKQKELLKNYWKFIFLISVTIYFEYGLLNLAKHLNIDMATISLSVFNQGILILWKISVFLYKGDYFMKLMWKMNNLAESANPKEYNIWLSENRRSQLIVKIYLYAALVATICSAILPIVFMAYDYYNKNEFKPKLPFGGKFPYDNGSLLHFVLHYILFMISILALLNMTIGIDGLYGWYIYNVSAHFRILRVKVENAALKLENDDCKWFTKDIGAVVCYHNKILKFVKDFNAIFGYILWAEVMFNCLQLCFSIYSLNNDDNMANMPFNCTVSLAIVVQLIIYCFGGEKVKIENDMLCMELYFQFPWHKMSIEEKQLMLLPLMRSQTPSNLRGLFFEVNRGLMVYIIKTAFSFYALLSAVNKK